MTDTKTLEAVARAIDPDAWTVEMRDHFNTRVVLTEDQQASTVKAQAAIDAYLKAIRNERSPIPNGLGPIAVTRLKLERLRK